MVEAPVVVEPAVERVEVRVQLIGVVLQEMFDADAECREDERALDSLAIHDGETSLAVDVLRLHGFDHV